VSVTSNCFDPCRVTRAAESQLGAYFTEPYLFHGVVLRERAQLSIPNVNLPAD